MKNRVAYSEWLNSLYNIVGKDIIDRLYLGNKDNLVAIWESGLSVEDVYNIYETVFFKKASLPPIYAINQ